MWNHISLANTFLSLLYFPHRSHESLRISRDTPASDHLATISRPVFPRTFSIGVVGAN